MRGIDERDDDAVTTCGCPAATLDTIRQTPMPENDSATTPADRRIDPAVMGTAADPDEYLDTTDEDWARAHIFRDGRYLGPAPLVAANGWEPVVGPKEQHRSVLDVLKGESRQG
jgi:hypothetical protein